mmetsp:Transcript_26741/g.39618  ORF Transcript_26741/g.39618 Transcript_26741/m.39618 type:complete len:245 (-) Transcript_26741:442-1176(-)
MECMLRNVSNTCVRMLPYFSLLRLNFSNKKLDHGRLSCSVLSNTGNTRRKGYLDRDVEKSRNSITSVGKGTLRHLHQCLTLGLDSLDRTGLGETELKLGSSKVKVSTSLGMDLNKLIKISLECVKLQVINLKNMGTAIIEKSRVVGYNDGGNISQRVEVVLYPSNVDNIKMVRRLIEKKDISLLKHRTCESKLHTPSSGERRYRVVRLCFSVSKESYSRKNLTHLLFGTSKSLNLLIMENIVDT